MSPDSNGVPNHPTPAYPPADDLTVVVPTRNRRAFLARMLRFSELVRLPYRIVVMDSSEPAQAAANAALVAGYSGRLRAEFHPSCPDLLGKLKAGIDKVATPYACFWADDDFQTPEGLVQCLEVLRSNPAAGSCLGRMLAVRTGPSGLEGFDSTFPARNEPDAAERMRIWSENFYSTFYAVYRTPQLVRSLEITLAASSYERCRIIPEILLGQLSQLQAPQATADVCSIVYQMHAANDSRLTPTVRDHDNFPAEYAHYRRTFAPFVSELAGLPAVEAGRLIDSTYRNVHRWTGGPGWLFKKAIENIRRPWKRWQLRLDEKRAVPRYPRVINTPVSESALGAATGGVKTALDLIRSHPSGVE
jgi:glycosyltransferase domain-containing protein